MDVHDWRKWMEGKDDKPATVYARVISSSLSLKYTLNELY